MDVVTVSSKYQVVIPRKVREELDIHRGQKMQVVAYENRVVLIPIRPIEEARGSLKGIETDPKREEEDRNL
jgi:AbrB family looped-hinge helix DNA binding protein